MEANTKRLPYGISNLGRVVTENYAYVDKTQFIELLENESNSNQFFIRPRKFGKTLFYYISLRHLSGVKCLYSSTNTNILPTT
ncbi:MAG: AAA family ATPase [Tannerella sp.]|jgi:hypothetical protein|nr:AAA family ATPase [Tannerella sp.]